MPKLENPFVQFGPTTVVLSARVKSSDMRSVHLYPCIDEVVRVKVAESSQIPISPMTADPSGISTVEPAYTIPDVWAGQGAVTYEGIGNDSVLDFRHSIPTRPDIVGPDEKVTVGVVVSPDTQSLYQQATFIEPDPIPELVVPSAYSVTSIQPVGIDAVIA